MRIAVVCLLFAAILPYVAVGMAKWNPNFDNARPRDWLEALEGWHKRAYWAHQNSFEAFPSFAAAVIVAMMTGVRGSWIDALALVFVAARIGYITAYVADRPTVRTLMWSIATMAWIALFIAAALSY